MNKKYDVYNVEIFVEMKDLYLTSVVWLRTRGTGENLCYFKMSKRITIWNFLWKKWSLPHFAQRKAMSLVVRRFPMWMFLPSLVLLPTGRTKQEKLRLFQKCLIIWFFFFEILEKERIFSKQMLRFLRVF